MFHLRHPASRHWFWYSVRRRRAICLFYFIISYFPAELLKCGSSIFKFKSDLIALLPRAWRFAQSRLGEEPLCSYNRWDTFSNGALPDTSALMEFHWMINVLRTHYVSPSIYLYHYSCQRHRELRRTNAENFLIRSLF